MKKSVQPFRQNGFKMEPAYKAGIYGKKPKKTLDLAQSSFAYDVTT
jgi:hypothetical protein